MADEKIDRPASPNSPGTPRKRRRWLRALLIVVVVLIVIVLLLPTILSTGIGTAIVEGQINSRIKGSVQIDSLSTGWFTAARVGRITIKDPSGKTIAVI